jgi:hypothetical protein
MQQRRLRLGDILDDYCPRERRITNHAVVAMIEEEVKQTRCTTCDAEHEYKQAKVPSSRRKKSGDGPAPDLLDVPPPVPSLAAADTAPDSLPPATFPDEDVAPFVAADADGDAETETDPEPVIEDDGPVHRPLIRATLPRPEGQAPERKAPDFTIRQPGGRFDQNRNNGQRHRGRPQGRSPQGSSNSNGQPARFGGPRHGGAGQGGAAHGSRPGNRSGNGTGQRGGRPPGPNRGPRPGGQGRKRGR